MDLERVQVRDVDASIAVAAAFPPGLQHGLPAPELPEELAPVQDERQHRSQERSQARARLFERTQAQLPREPTMPLREALLQLAEQPFRAQPGASLERISILGLQAESGRLDPAEVALAELPLSFGLALLGHRPSQEEGRRNPLLGEQERETGGPAGQTIITGRGGMSPRCALPRLGTAVAGARTGQDPRQEKVDQEREQQEQETPQTDPSLLRPQEPCSSLIDGYDLRTSATKP